VITKDLYTYTTIFLRHDKTLRDHSPHLGLAALPEWLWGLIGLSGREWWRPGVMVAVPGTAAAAGVAGVPGTAGVAAGVAGVPGTAGVAGVPGREAPARAGTGPTSYE
jgi:hypothetical protein